MEPVPGKTNSPPTPCFGTLFEAFCYLHLQRILEFRRIIDEHTTITEWIFNGGESLQYDYTFVVNGREVTKHTPNFLELYNISNTIGKS